MKSVAFRNWNCTAAYGLMHSAAWSFYAIMLSFSSNVLYDYGFSDSAISLFLGIATGLSTLTQLLIAEHLSRHPEVPVYKLLMLLGGVMLICSAGMLIPGVPDAADIIAFAVCCMILQMLPSFANAIGMDSIKRGAPTHYSIARGTGSLAYSISAMVTGIAVRNIGTRMVCVFGAVSAGALILSALWYHLGAERQLAEVQTNVQEKGTGSFLGRYPGYALFLAGTVFLCISHSLLCNFMYQIMLSKNGGAVEQGIATSVSALVELPVMFGFPLMLRKLRCDKWVRFAAVAMSLKPLGILLASAPGGVYLAQATQMIGYGLLIIGSVNYAERIVAPGESIRAQSYHGAAVTVSSVAALSAGGVIIDYFGADALVMVSLICSCVGGVIVALAARRTDS